jgi:hypothetical protein
MFPVARIGDGSLLLTRVGNVAAHVLGALHLNVQAIVEQAHEGFALMKEEPR